MNRNRRLYMATTADRFELPCFVGTAREIAQFAGLTLKSFYCAVSRQRETRSGYRIYMVDDNGGK